MKNNPFISVIIPTYNSARYLPQAIESVLSQSYRPLELLVIDDGSTDRTLPVLEPYQTFIRYYWQPNGGPARARNRGIAEARGQLIAFLDADDIWLPNKLSQQVQCLERSPEAALVHSDVYYLDDATGIQSQRDVGRSNYTGNCYRLLLDHNRITFSTVLVWRKYLEQVGGFDEQIRYASTEDHDLLLRLARGFPFAYLPEPLAKYRLHNENAIKILPRMVAGHLAVLEKSLRDDPTMINLIGKRQVREKLFALLFGLGCFAFEHEDLAEARRYFRRAVLTRQHVHRAGIFYLASCIPMPLLRSLRSFCRKVRQALSSSASGRATDQCQNRPTSVSL